MVTTPEATVCKTAEGALTAQKRPFARRSSAARCGVSLLAEDRCALIYP